MTLHPIHRRQRGDHTDSQGEEKAADMKGNIIPLTKATKGQGWEAGVAPSP